MIRFSTLLFLAFALAPTSIAAAKADDGTTATKAAVRIRLRFVDTDVSDVLQAIGLRTHANIVFPSQLKKPISLDITASSVNEAISYATAAAGLAYRQIGHTFVVGMPEDLRRLIEPFGQTDYIGVNTLSVDDAIKLLSGALPYLTLRPAGNRILAIGTPEDIQQGRDILAQQEKLSPNDPQTNDVLVVNNESAPQVATLLKSMYPNLKVEAVGEPNIRGGAIGVNGPKSQVEAARETVVRLDAPDSGLRRVYKVFPLRYVAASSALAFLGHACPAVVALSAPATISPKAPQLKAISSTLTSGSSGGGGGGPTISPASGSTNGGSGPATVVDDEHTRTLVISGSQQDVDVAVKLLDQIDIPPAQVMVEVKVVDTSPEEASNLGVTWTWNPLDFLEYQPGTQINSTHTDAMTPTTVPARIGTFSTADLEFNATLNAMVQKNSAKILADPSIQVVDNEDASIFIGQTLRTLLTVNTLAGQTTSLVEFPIGIILLVRPRISDDGKITMHVHPVVSLVTGLNSDNLPQTSSREAETTVRVKDGDTVVIGGLIQDQMSKIVQEVPFLSKLPLIGALFRNRSTDHTHSDVMVFITPHIIKDDKSTVVKPPAPIMNKPEQAHG